MKKQTSARSIRSMLLRPMLGISLAAAIVFASILLLTRVFTTMRTAEEAELTRNVLVKGETLERFLGEASNAAQQMAQGIQQDALDLFPDTPVIADSLQHASPQTSALLAAAAGHTKNALQSVRATGAFVLLDSSLSQGIYMQNAEYSGIPLLVDGPREIAQTLGLSLYADWDEELRLERFSDLSFIDQLYRALKDDPLMSLEQRSFWVGPVTYRQQAVFLYVTPLLDSQKNPYGVVGIEVSEQSLQSVLGDFSPAANAADYFLLLQYQPSDFQGSTDPADSIFWGSGISADAREQLTVALAQPFEEEIAEITIPGGQTFSATTLPLSDGRRLQTQTGTGSWRLWGGTSAKNLYQVSNALLLSFALAVSLAVMVGLFVSLLATRRVVAPFQQLSEQLRTADPSAGVALDKVHIQEFDELIDAIQSLSQELAATGARTLDTISITGMAIGFYEIDYAKKRVFSSDMAFDLFGIHKETGNFMTLDRWNETWRALISFPKENDPDLYVFHRAQRDTRWLRIKTAHNENKTFGIIMEVTNEIKERQQLEHDRDTDPLTGLYNRMSFFEAARDVVRQNPEQQAMMLFADLDNLKFVNDSYGHDFGDRHIQAAADGFNRLAQNLTGIAARISGDEFAVFLFLVKSPIDTIRSIHDFDISAYSITLPNGSKIRLRASMGIARYPQDSTDLKKLLKYADFAMSEAKRTQKGGIRQFDHASYLKNSFLVERIEDLNRMVEQNLVHYAFQPIVDARTGAVFAFEALMRPLSDDLPSLKQILQLAEAQAKLYQIERMTCFNLYRWLSENHEQLGSRLLFFNTLPNQILSEQDQAELEQLYRTLFSKTVAEVGYGIASPGFLSDKMSAVHRMGIPTALDDFGSSGDNMLLQVDPNYIKIDAGLVREIDQNADKQKLVTNIVEYAAPRGIKTIAVGIETRGEMEALATIGVDYLQGYYLARPVYSLQEPDPKIPNQLRTLAQNATS